ncbi:sphingoid long-chain bases kinase 1 [Forsythia ovata]|uniref:Sphingoid long-chain bases kinase 1 n=1 Tax=Forsythia ovata TaxID=205694 RepID=A0ABD1U9C5_9LAMI
MPRINKIEVTVIPTRLTLQIVFNSFGDSGILCKELVWGSEMLSLEDVISSQYLYTFSLAVITLCWTETFYSACISLSKRLCGLFMRRGKSLKDYRFVASTSEDALQWVNAFAYQQCYVNCLPHPMASKKHGSDSIVNEFPPESIRCKSPPKMLVILNPRSGRGRSSKVFGLVEPIFKWDRQTQEWPSVIKTFKVNHQRNGEWVNERATQDYEKMVEEWEEQTQQTSCSGVTVNKHDVVLKVLGEKRGHRRAVGWVLRGTFLLLVHYDIAGPTQYQPIYSGN